MRIGRTEQWLLLAVLLAAAGWVLMLVYARLTNPDGTETSTSAAATTDADADTDTATATATAPSPATASASGPSEMVFSEADLAPATAAAATAAPATSAPASTAPVTAAGPARSGEILVVSEPIGARVMDDGDTIGRTPMRFPRPTAVDAARYLLIAKTGYRGVRIALTPTSPERISVTLRLPEP